MDTNAQLTGKARNADYVVRTPRATDALGHTLRDIFGKAALPDDMMMLLRQLDHATH